MQKANTRFIALAYTHTHTQFVLNENCVDDVCLLRTESLLLRIYQYCAFGHSCIDESEIRNKRHLLHINTLSVSVWLYVCVWHDTYVHFDASTICEVAVGVDDRFLLVGQ